MNSNPTQCRLILEALTQDGGWIEMPLLAMKSGAFAVATRVSELRRNGYDIVNRVETHDKRKHSFYKLNK